MWRFLQDTVVWRDPVPAATRLPYDAHQQHFSRRVLAMTEVTAGHAKVVDRAAPIYLPIPALISVTFCIAVMQCLVKK